MSSNHRLMRKVRERRVEGFSYVPRGWIKLPSSTHLSGSFSSLTLIGRRIHPTLFHHLRFPFGWPSLHGIPI